MTPETKDLLKRLGISAADLLEWAVKVKAQELDAKKEGGTSHPLFNF